MANDLDCVVENYWVFFKASQFSLQIYLLKVSINENRKFEYTTRVTRENQNKLYRHLAAKK